VIARLRHPEPSGGIVHGVSYRGRIRSGEVGDVEVRGAERHCDRAAIGEHE
jgi:hypothetical protein